MIPEPARRALPTARTGASSLHLWSAYRSPSLHRGREQLGSSNLLTDRADSEDGGEAVRWREELLLESVVAAVEDSESATARSEPAEEYSAG